MPKGVAPEQHQEFITIARALMANGISDDQVARAVGYAGASSLRLVLDGTNPPTIARLRRLKAYVEAAPTPPDVPVNVDHAVLYLMGVWFFLDSQIDEGAVPPMLLAGYKEARTRTESLITFMGGDPPVVETNGHTTTDDDDASPTTH